MFFFNARLFFLIRNVAAFSLQTKHPKEGRPPPVAPTRRFRLLEALAGASGPGGGLGCFLQAFRYKTPQKNKEKTTRKGVGKLKHLPGVFKGAILFGSPVLKNLHLQQGTQAETRGILYLETNQSRVWRPTTNAFHPSWPPLHPGPRYRRSVAGPKVLGRVFFEKGNDRWLMHFLLVLLYFFPSKRSNQFKSWFLANFLVLNTLEESLYLWFLTDQQRQQTEPAAPSSSQGFSRVGSEHRRSSPPGVVGPLGGHWSKEEQQQPG